MSLKLQRTGLPCHSLYDTRKYVHCYGLAGRASDEHASVTILNKQSVHLSGTQASHASDENGQ